jgi:hypothetical protein
MSYLELCTINKAVARPWRERRLLRAPGFFWAQKLTITLLKTPKNSQKIKILLIFSIIIVSLEIVYVLFYEYNSHEISQ